MKEKIERGKEEKAGERRRSGGLGVSGRPRDSFRDEQRPYFTQPTLTAAPRTQTSFIATPKPVLLIISRESAHFLWRCTLIMGPTDHAE